MIDTLVDAGFSVQRCCQVLEVSSQGYYAYRRRPLSPTKMRREWLTALIREVHADSRGTYGCTASARRTHQRSWDPRQLESGDAPHAQRRRLLGFPVRRKVRRIKGAPSADDLVDRKFARSGLDELWVTDITEHRTREGKVYCCAVMDTCSRRIVGWSIDSVQDAQLVINALDMAIQQRDARGAARSSTPTTESSSPRGPSPTRSAKPA